jgi:hypothetical protein
MDILTSERRENAWSSTCNILFREYKGNMPIWPIRRLGAKDKIRFARQTRISAMMCATGKR